MYRRDVNWNESKTRGILISANLTLIVIRSKHVQLKNSDLNETLSIFG